MTSSIPPDRTPRGKSLSQVIDLGDGTFLRWSHGDGSDGPLDYGAGDGSIDFEVVSADDALDPAGGADVYEGADPTADPVSSDATPLPDEPLPDDGPVMTLLAPEARDAVRKAVADLEGVSGLGEPPEEFRGDLEHLPGELRDRVAMMLLFYKAVTPAAVRDAWKAWGRLAPKDRPAAFWRLLLDDPAADRGRILEVAAQVYAFEHADVVKSHALSFLLRHRGAFSKESWAWLKEHHIIPLAQEQIPGAVEPVWIFGTPDPSHPDIARVLTGFVKGYRLKYLSEQVAGALIEQGFPGGNEYLERIVSGATVHDLGASAAEAARGQIDEATLELEVKNSRLINLVEAMLVEAVHRDASDIHVYVNQNGQVEIHFRIDAELEHWYTEEWSHPEAFLAVVKDKAVGVDRFRQENAQDGFIQRRIRGALISFRVSVLPVANLDPEIRAESIVIRVLDNRRLSRLQNLEALITGAEDLNRFEWALGQPQGMVILTGPTGSGKSTTLAAAIQRVTTPKRNLVTLEDPIEYVLPGVRQVKLGHNLLLADALRYVLRHDPDIVMVGEMRDNVTADLAIKLANTGHLTFSTLHTNDAPSAVSRLFKMGIEPFLIAHAVNLIVAQRLVRKLCPACRIEDRTVTPGLLAGIGFAPGEEEGVVFYEAFPEGGCEACHGAGYRGRQAIMETMVCSPAVRHLIVTAKDMVDEGELRRQAVSEGMNTLLASAREMVTRGETSLGEVMRSVASPYRPR